MGDRDQKYAELSKEMSIMDKMLSALLELLDEKGLVLEEEFESRMKEKIEESVGLEPYRNLQANLRK